MELVNFDGIENYLLGLGRPGVDYKIERMHDVMSGLGNPQNKLRVIHVAGTSGKTSTSYYVAALLQASGVKVGLTISPHISSIRERVQINLQPISEEEFVGYFQDFIQHIGEFSHTLSYFEIMIAFAYYVFEKEAVDYAVIEVGIGGLLDATNVISNDSKVCVITDIGFDHTALLGNTLGEIAAQKAGIITPHNHVVMYRQASDIMGVVRTRVKDMAATLEEIDPDVSAEASGVSVLPRYQQHNWNLAYKVWQYLAGRDSLAMTHALRDTFVIVPGRLEVYELDGKTIILDGAHNPQKMSTMLASLRTLYPDVHFSLGIAMKDDKDYISTLRVLLPLVSEVVGTIIYAEQDMRFQSVSEDRLADECQKNHVSFTWEPDHNAFLDKLRMSHESHILITGSLYLVSSIRSLLQDLQKQR